MCVSQRFRSVCTRNELINSCKCKPVNVGDSPLEAEPVPSFTSRV